MDNDTLSARLGTPDVERLQATLPWARDPVVRRRLRALLCLARGQPFAATARRFRVAPIILQQWVRVYLRRRAPEALFYRRGQCGRSRPRFTEPDRLQLQEALQADLAPALRRRLEALYRVASGEPVAAVRAQLKLAHGTLPRWMALYLKRRRSEDLYERLHPGRPGLGAKFTPRDRQRLQAALTTDLSDQSRQRIQTVLRRAQGESMTAIAAQCQVCSLSIDHWTARYLKRHRVEDLCFVNGREPAALGRHFQEADRRRLRRALQKQHAPRVRQRIAALLGVAEGESVPRVAQRLQCSRTSIHTWVRRYLKIRCLIALDPPRGVHTSRIRTQFRPQDRTQLRNAVAATRAAAASRRLKAVLEVAEGQGIAATARKYGVRRSSVHRWLTRFLQRRRGEDLSGPASGPRRRRLVLSAKEQVALHAALAEPSPRRLQQPLRALLRLGQGESIARVARRVGRTVSAVRQWLNRYLKRRRMTDVYVRYRNGPKP